LGLSSNLIGEWNHPNVSLGIRILILNSIREKIIFDSHWFMKDEKANIGRKDFNTSIRQGEQAQGGVKEAYQERGVHVFFLEEKVVHVFFWEEGAGE
jgi:hypothetical protein